MERLYIQRKERQKFFDVVKKANDGEFPVITYNKKRYKLIALNRKDLLPNYDNKIFSGYGHAVVYNSQFRSNIIVEWSEGKRFYSYGIACDYWSRNRNRLLCYAIELNQEKLHIAEAKNLGLM